jgi:diguanylate cyclase (GGDEF)-like protein/PAS domain S-box-containing protein
MRRILILALIGSAFSLSFCQPAAPRAQPTLTSVNEVRRFKPGASPDPVPVHLRAVVTYYDSVAPNLFVQDATGGVWVDLRGLKDPPPRLGQSLEITGVVGVGFTPYVANPKWKILGSAPLPNPVRLSYEQAASGSFDSQWAQMEGIVRSFAKEAEGNVLVIDVVTPTGAFKVRVPDYHDGFPLQLVDAKVQFTGVCGTAFNRRDQLVAIHLMVSGMANAKVIQAAPADPFSVPTTNIDQIGRFSAQSTEIHRVKVQGVVTAQFPGRGLFLMDGTGGVYAETQDGDIVEAGDEVELIGFPASGNYSPVLKSASILPTGKHQFIPSAKIDGKTALKGGYDARLVTISGTVQAVNPFRGSYTLVLQSEDHVNFTTRFAVRPYNHPIPSKDSKLSLTGICSVKSDENGNPAAFEIVLRTPEDITLLSSPPWLTGGRAALILSAVGLITAAVFGWVLILRRRVRSQTRLIKVRLENEAALEKRYLRMFQRNLTGLYIATADGHIIDCNETSAHILGYPSRLAMLEDRTNVELVTAQFHEHLYDDSAGGANQVLNAEYRFRCPDGKWKWVLANVRSVNQTETAPAIIEGGLIDITDRKAAEDQVQYLAYYDSLTGLPNRSLLKDRLGHALATARRHKEKVAVLFLDLDRFKIINDSLGHSMGDLLLREVALRLKNLSREEDTVARIGGDEFLVVLTSIKETADAAITAERIAKAMDHEFIIGGHSFKVTCSIGISIFPENGNDDEALIKNADAAMYSAKENGRFTFRFFTDDMNAQVVERLTLEHDLRLALEREQFFLVYQPQMSLVTGEITGFEALLRWQHPVMGLIPPGRFISVAENSGLIIPIGEWVLRTACAQARKWIEAGLRVPSIAVNVSAIQFRQEGFSKLVKTVLHDTALPPRCLELELTESLLLSSGDAIFSLLGELKSMGVNLAIDDFGTGYSSLTYLRQFPVGKLKIDGSFIKDIAINPDDAAIATAVIEMSKALNLKVIAECVETEAQLAFLQSRQCDEIQGYYFSKPLSAADAEQRMRLDQPDMAAGNGSFTGLRLLEQTTEPLVGGA